MDKKMDSGPLGFQDVLAFVLEMGALVLWGLWAWSLSSQLLWKVMLAALAVGVFIAFWALFFARKARHRPSIPWLFTGKLLLLLPPGLLYFSTNPMPAVVWGVMVLYHLQSARAGNRCKGGRDRC